MFLLHHRGEAGRRIIARNPHSRTAAHEFTLPRPYNIIETIFARPRSRDIIARRRRRDRDKIDRRGPLRLRKSMTERGPGFCGTVC